jgi:hypothetical protein
MVQIIPVELSDAGIHFGALRLTRAEWWEEAPRFVLLRFEDGIGMRPYGVRMDMDKKTFLDSLDDLPLDNQLRAKKDEIWRLIAERLPKVVQSGSFAFI